MTVRGNEVIFHSALSFIRMSFCRLGLNWVLFESVNDGFCIVPSTNSPNIKPLVFKCTVKKAKRIRHFKGQWNLTNSYPLNRRANKANRNEKISTFTIHLTSIRLLFASNTAGESIWNQSKVDWPVDWTAQYASHLFHDERMYCYSRRTQPNYVSLRSP